MTDFSAGMFNLKFPLGVVIQPTVAPFTMTVAPGNGFPEAASVTRPEI
jgi:hypothetical protein